MTQSKEAHHFYPVLFYFRFSDPYHSVSRSALVALDTVSLIKSALDDGKYGWLKKAGAITRLWEGSMMLITALEETFLPEGARNQGADEQTRDRWRARYDAALRRLRHAGIQTTDDPKAGADAYIYCRIQWDHHIASLAPSMGYSMTEIDAAVSALGFGGKPERCRIPRALGG
jgi:hypothetical protein